MASRNAIQLGPFAEMMRFIFKNILMHICLIFGLFGNILTIITLADKRMRRSSPARYILAITFLDTIYLICTFVSNIEIMYSSLDLESVAPFLSIISYPLSDFAGNASTYCIVMFTVERFLAVSHPLKSRIWCRPAQTRRVICWTVFVCFVCTFPTFLENKIVFRWDDRANKTIPILTDSDLLSFVKPYMYLYFWFIATFFQFVPLTLLIIFNSILINYLNKDRILRRRQSTISRCSSMRLYRIQKKPKKSEKVMATMLLVATVLVFVICQLPSALLLIYASIFPLSCNKGFLSSDTVIGLNNIANGLVCIAASTNFILYSCISKKFRRKSQRLILRSLFSKSKSNRNTTSVKITRPAINNSNKKKVQFSTKPGRTINEGNFYFIFKDYRKIHLNFIL